MSSADRPKEIKTIVKNTDGIAGSSMTKRLDVEGSEYDVRVGGDQPRRNSSSNEVGQQEQDRAGWGEDGRALRKRCAKRTKRGRGGRQETGGVEDDEVLLMRDCFFFVCSAWETARRGRTPSRAYRLCNMIPAQQCTCLLLCLYSNTLRHINSEQVHYTQSWLLYFHIITHVEPPGSLFRYYFPYASQTLRQSLEGCPSSSPSFKGDYNQETSPSSVFWILDGCCLTRRTFSADISIGMRKGDAPSAEQGEELKRALNDPFYNHRMPLTTFPCMRRASWPRQRRQAFEPKTQLG